MNILAVICASVVGFVIGAVAMLVVYSYNKNKSSAHSDDIESVLNKCTENVKSVSRNISRIEKEIVVNSNDIYKLHNIIKEVKEKSSYLSKETDSSDVFNIGTLNKSNNRNVQEQCFTKVSDNTDVTDSNPPPLVKNNAVNQNTYVQNTAPATNNNQQSPEISTSGDGCHSVLNSEADVYSMQEVFQMVKVRQESLPEYRIFNFQTNKIEYSNNKSAQYILSDNRRYLMPNFVGPFQKSSLSDNVYKCNTDLIYGTNKIILCEVDGNGQVIKKGTIS